MVIVALSITVTMILINNYRLESKINEYKVIESELKAKIKEYEDLQALALKKAEDDAIAIKEDVAKVDVVYKPIKEYIIKYKGSNNDECKDANELINSTIY